MVKKPQKGKSESRQVEVMALGQEAKKIDVTGRETIRNVLNKAGITSDNVMADGKRVSGSESIGNTKVLNAIPKVKGGGAIKKAIDVFFGAPSPYPYAIKIKERAFLKIYYYTKLHPEEVGGLLKVDYNGKAWIIEDAILLPQTTFPAFFSINQQALAKFVSVVPKEDFKKWKGWWHSHVNMDAFWSSEDMDTFKGLKNVMGDVMGIVINKRLEHEVGVYKDDEFYAAKLEIIPENHDESRYFYELNLSILEDVED